MRVVCRPEFLQAPDGARFIQSHLPPRGVARGRLVLLQPFAEEANKSRRMLSEIARAAARAGWHTVIGDCIGTGDSHGDFADATWAGWTADVMRFAATPAEAPNTPVVLAGLRVGALLASAALQAGLAADAVLAINPVTSGKQSLTQFLRLGAAGELGHDASARIDTRALREALDRGETVEIAGYGLAPGLAVGLDAAEFVVPAGGGRVGWIEIAANAADGLSPAAGRAIERLRSEGLKVESVSVTGPAFWQTQEIEAVEELPERFVALLDVLTGAAAA